MEKRLEVERSFIQSFIQVHTHGSDLSETKVIIFSDLEAHTTCLWGT